MSDTKRSETEIGTQHQANSAHTPEALRRAIDSFAAEIAKMARARIQEQLEPQVGPLYVEDAITRNLELHPGATRTELMRLTGFSPDLLTRSCARLQATGRVYKMGGRRYARWYLAGRRAPGR